MPGREIGHDRRMLRDPLPPELTGSSFTTAQARAAGVDRGRLRGDDVLNPHYGVHVAVADALDDDVVARCERLIPALGERHWFSHRTAARVWGMPLQPAYSPGEALHVLSSGTPAPLRHAGTVGWVSADRELPVEMVGLVPVVSAAEVWCQLAHRGAIIVDEVIAHEWLVAAGDFLTTGRRRPDGRRDTALCSIDDLRAAIDRRPRRGSVALHRALADVRSPVDSAYETRFRLGLVRHGLPEPEVQLAVETAEGVRHADLGYRAARVALEYQGDEHRRSRERWLRDLTRVQLLQDAGYHVILVGAADLDPDCGALAARVRRALLARTPR